LRFVNDRDLFQEKQFGSIRGEGNKSIRDQAMAVALALAIKITAGDKDHCSEKRPEQRSEHCSGGKVRWLKIPAARGNNGEEAITIMVLAQMFL